MGNSYFNLGLSQDTMLNDIATQLLAQYGAGVTIHYKTVNDLVFSCAAISDKVIRLNYASPAWTIYYATSWTSGTTLVNSIIGTKILGYPMLTVQFILGDNFMLFNSTHALAVTSVLSIIAKTQADRFLFFSFCGNVPNIAGTYYAGSCKNLTDGSTVMLKTFDGKFLGAENKLYKLPLLICTGNDGKLLLKTDGSPDGITGLYVASYAAGVVPLVGPSSFLSTTVMYSENAIARLGTSLLAEF